jgi:glutaredoxin|tara:strand:- start:1803 stop:1997 length:195 start_codon:yes stop_codon:yes gene_type:complete
MAADICEAKKIDYIFLDYSKNTSILEDYKKFHNHETVPIILSNNQNTGLTKKIGGYTNLLEHLD